MDCDLADQFFDVEFSSRSFHTTALRNCCSLMDRHGTSVRNLPLARKRMSQHSIPLKITSLRRMSSMATPASPLFLLSAVAMTLLGRLNPPMGVVSRWSMSGRQLGGMVKLVAAVGWRSCAESSLFQFSCHGCSFHLLLCHFAAWGVCHDWLWVHPSCLSHAGCRSVCSGLLEVS